MKNKVTVKGVLYCNEAAYDDMMTDLIRTKKEWTEIIKSCVSSRMLRGLQIKMSNIYYEIDEGRPRNTIDITLIGERKNIESFIKQMNDNNDAGFGFIYNTNYPNYI